MHQIRSSDIENKSLDDSFYKEISGMVSTKKRKETMRRSVLLLIIALSLIGFILAIYVITYISRLKAEKAGLIKTIEDMEGKMKDLSVQHTLLSDTLSRTQEDYMTLSQKLEKQTEYYSLMEKENEMKLAELMNKDFDYKKNSEVLSNEISKLQGEKVELKDIIKKMAIKVEEFAKKGDENIFKKIRNSLKKIKKKVTELISR